MVASPRLISDPIDGASASHHPSRNGRYAADFLRTLEESPNGDLYFQSRFLEDLRTSPKTSLGHVTYRLEDIRRDKAIYASGGCLVGSVYCFPMNRMDGQSFRLHNLGRYIYTQETAGRSPGTTPDVLLFEIERGGKAHQDQVGIDYLRLGEIHYRLFMDLEHLLCSQNGLNSDARWNHASDGHCRS